MALFSKIRGTIETLFQLGIGGPQLKRNASAIEARNAADSGFAVARGAPPVGDNDFTTKQYVDTNNIPPAAISLQFNGGSALPTNSGTEQFYLVTTTGGTATIGQLLWDDGSGSGNVAILAASSRLVVTKSAFSGGTISLLADSLYFWDTGSSTWVNAGGSQTSGSVREVRFAITNAASQSSATIVPANARILSTELELGTPFSAGGTVAIGQTGTTALLQATTDNNPQGSANDIYQTMGDTAWGASALAVLVTIAGAPAAGSGFVIVRYSVPDA